jgi:flavodoxin I
MRKIGLFYWPLKGNVEKVAKAIESRFPDTEIDIMDLSKVEPKYLFYYKNLILGCSTVGADHWVDATADNKWYQLFHEMEKDHVDLMEKNVAIFGLGDHVKYPHNFVDGIERIYSRIAKHNINLIGEVENEGYEFYESMALHGNKFRGLPLDLDNNPETMDEKIDQWLKQLEPLFK